MHQKQYRHTHAYHLFYCLFAWETPSKYTHSIIDRCTYVYRATLWSCCMRMSVPVPVPTCLSVFFFVCACVFSMFFCRHNTSNNTDLRVDEIHSSRGQLISKCEREWRLHYNFASVWNWFLLIANVCASIIYQSNRERYTHIQLAFIISLFLMFCLSFCRDFFLLHFGVNPFGNYQYVNRLEFQCDRIALRVCHLM